MGDSEHTGERRTAVRRRRALMALGLGVVVLGIVPGGSVLIGRAAGGTGGCGGVQSSDDEWSVAPRRQPLLVHYVVQVGGADGPLAPIAFAGGGGLDAGADSGEQAPMPVDLFSGAAEDLAGWERWFVEVRSFAERCSQGEAAACGGDEWRAAIKPTSAVVEAWAGGRLLAAWALDDVWPLALVRGPREEDGEGGLMLHLRLAAEVVGFGLREDHPAVARLCEAGGCEGWPLFAGASQLAPSSAGAAPGIDALFERLGPQLAAVTADEAPAGWELSPLRADLFDLEIDGELQGRFARVVGLGSVVDARSGAFATSGVTFLNGSGTPTLRDWLREAEPKARNASVVWRSLEPGASNSMAAQAAGIFFDADFIWGGTTPRRFSRLSTIGAQAAGILWDGTTPRRFSPSSTIRAQAAGIMWDDSEDEFSLPKRTGVAVRRLASVLWDEEMPALRLEIGAVHPGASDEDAIVLAMPPAPPANAGVP